MEGGGQVSYIYKDSMPADLWGGGGGLSYIPRTLAVWHEGSCKAGTSTIDDIQRLLLLLTCSKGCADRCADWVEH